MANIKQVAERAGVSSATVSRVLAGSAPVTEAYRERVLQAVAELGYRPNRIASNLRRQQSQTIGVVVADIGNPHFAELLRTVEAAAYEQGYRVLLCNTDDQAVKQRSYLEVLAAERVQGVILAPSEPNGAEIGELWDLGIPVVAFDRSVTEPRTDAVIADNVEGVRRATELLLDAEHTRIGFISGAAGLQSGDERLVGYEQAMRSRGLEPHVASGEFHIAPAQAAAERLLASSDGLTGLVVANNLMTIGALRAIRTHGLANTGRYRDRDDRRSVLGGVRRTAADGLRPAGAPDGGERLFAATGAHWGIAKSGEDGGLWVRSAPAALVRDSRVDAASCTSSTRRRQEQANIGDGFG